MPRVNLAKNLLKDAPPIDWMRAAILERIDVLGYDLKTLSKIAEVDYGTFRHYIRKSPWEWPNEVRNRVCDVLGLIPVQTVQTAPLEDYRKGKR